MRPISAMCLRCNGNRARVLTRFGLAGLTALLMTVLPVRAADLDIVEVTSETGVTAWLVEDQTDPTVAVSFAFAGGSNQEPAGKEGMADLLVSLLDEGAGELDSEAFQQRLYETGAQLSFSASSNRITGELNMLADEIEEPLELLSLALTAPRFDEQPVERMRSVLLSQIRAESNDPDEQGQRALAAALYGDHPLGRQPTLESLQAVSREDLEGFHRRTFARSNLFIGVVGAIDPETLRSVLDEVFAELPAEADLKEVPPPDLNFGEEVVQVYDRPQSSISLVYPGVAATNDDIYAASVVAEVMGGGGLVSRLFTEVRERRGLAYGAGAFLDSDIDWGRLVVYTSTSANQTGEALGAVREVVQNMAEEGPTAEELESAKRYLIGSYAIGNLSSTTSIARTLVSLQRLGRGRDYLERRDALFNAVTLEDARNMASRLLSVEPTMLIVGPEVEEAADQDG